MWLRHNFPRWAENASTLKMLDHDKFSIDEGGVGVIEHGDSANSSNFDHRIRYCPDSKY